MAELNNIMHVQTNLCKKDSSTSYDVTGKKFISKGIKNKYSFKVFFQSIL